MFHVMLQESRFVFRRPLIIVSWALLTGLVVLAMSEGIALVEHRGLASAAFTSGVEKTFDERRAAAAEVAAGTRKIANAREAYGAGRVNGVRVPVVMKGAPIHAFSPGVVDSYPTVGAVGVFTAPSGFLERAIPVDPESEGWGHLDMTLAVVVLLPLWLLLVFHDTLAHERDRGLFRILEGNGVSRGRILSRRLPVPIIVGLTGWTLAFVVGCLVTGAWNGVGSEGWLWFAGTLGYAMFWMGAYSFLASRAISAQVSVTAGLGCWIVIVVLLPGLIDVVLRTASHPAMGAEVVIRKRDATAKAERERAEVLSKYMFDHPELAGDGNNKKGRFTSDFLRDYFVSQESVAASLAPVISHKDADSERRSELVGTLSALVPSVWTRGILEDVAGTAPRHMLEFSRRSRAFAGDVRTNLRPFLWSGHLLTPEDFDQVPHYSGAREGPSGEYSLLRLFWLPFLGLIGLLLAHRNWQRVSAIGDDARP